MDADALRGQLAGRLVSDRILRDPAVERAVRAVPRHPFAPHVTLESAYQDRVIRIKEAGGTLISSLSQPAMIVEMLQQLDVRPGQRVLEIGTGTGYTTALLAELTGPAGFVATIDLEDDLVALARERFAALDLSNIAAFHGDGALGVPQHAPYDRILLTVCATDIEAAWWDQLATGGKLVLPLSLGGVQKSVAFAEREGRLFSEGSVDCSFVTLRGAAQNAAVTRLRETPDIYLMHQDADAGGEALARRFDSEEPLRTSVNGGSYSPRDFDGPAALWIALHDRRFCRFEFGPPHDARLPALYGDGSGNRLSLGLCEGDSAALLDARPAGATAELFITQFGNAGHLAERLAALIAGWNRAGRPGRSGIAINAERSARTPGTFLATAVLERPVTRFSVQMF